MAARRTLKLRSVSTAITPDVADAATSQAIDQITTALRRVEARRERVVVTTDLAVGTNRIRHGLGRPCVGYTLTPTVADATFAHAIDTDNPRPDLEVWIDVVGVSQPGARLEIY